MAPKRVRPPADSISLGNAESILKQSKERKKQEAASKRQAEPGGGHGGEPKRKKPSYKELEAQLAAFQAQANARQSGPDRQEPEGEREPEEPGGGFGEGNYYEPGGGFEEPSIHGSSAYTVPSEHLLKFMNDQADPGEEEYNTVNSRILKTEQAAYRAGKHIDPSMRAVNSANRRLPADVHLVGIDDPEVVPQLYPQGPTGSGGSRQERGPKGEPESSEVTNPTSSFIGHQIMQHVIDGDWEDDEVVSRAVQRGEELKTITKGDPAYEAHKADKAAGYRNNRRPYSSSKHPISLHHPYPLVDGIRLGFVQPTPLPQTSERAPRDFAANLAASEVAYGKVMHRTGLTGNQLQHFLPQRDQLAVASRLTLDPDLNRNAHRKDKPRQNIVKSPMYAGRVTSNQLSKYASDHHVTLEAALHSDKVPAEARAAYLGNERNQYYVNQDHAAVNAFVTNGPDNYEVNNAVYPETHVTGGHVGVGGARIPLRSATRNQNLKAVLNKQ
jgi:hypothetical protein